MIRGKSKIIKQLLAFGVVGGLATVFQYCILFLGVEHFDFPPAESSAVGFFMSSILNYILNYRFTFKSSQKHISAIVKFYTVVLCGLTLNYCAMNLLISGLAVHYFSAQLISTILVFLLNYSLNAVWTFSPKCSKG